MSKQTKKQQGPFSDADKYVAYGRERDTIGKYVAYGREIAKRLPPSQRFIEDVCSDHRITPHHRDFEDRLYWELAKIYDDMLQLQRYLGIIE